MTFVPNDVSLTSVLVILKFTMDFTSWLHRQLTFENKWNASKMVVFVLFVSLLFRVVNNMLLILLLLQNGNAII